MKILFITHKFFPDIGGIEVNSEILATNFSKAGHEIVLLTWTKEKGDKNFPFTVVRNPGITQLFKYNLWADVVYENNPTLRLSWPAFILGKPYITALRTWINTGANQNSQDKFKIFWLKHAKAVIAVSKAVRDRCWPAATVIGNPYRADLFKIVEGVERTGGFVFMGRLVSDKGADQAIEALNVLNTRHSELHLANLNPALTIIGDGPEKENLRLKAEKYGLQSYIKFTGALRGETLVKTLNEHKILLVPSMWEEPFGNVALEGMACGCVPIVSDGGGLPDAVGDAGIVFKRGDVNALTNSIIEVLTNKDLLLKLKNAAITHLRNHEPDVVSTRYLEVIEGVNV